MCWKENGTKNRRKSPELSVMHVISQIDNLFTPSLLDNLKESEE